MTSAPNPPDHRGGGPARQPARPAVIFDMDGVLVASGPAHIASWKMTARRHGLTVGDEQLRALFGKTSRDIIRELWGGAAAASSAVEGSEQQSGGHGGRSPVGETDQCASPASGAARQAAGAIDDAFVKRVDDEKEAAYRDLVTGCVPLGIGLRETLAALRAAGIPIAIGTSGPRENVELVLRETRLEAGFDAIVTGADVQRGKPAPDVFLLAAERLATAPANCLVVEDAPAGIQAALAAGMAVAGLTGTHPRGRLEQEHPTAVIDRLAEISPQAVAAWTRAARAGSGGTGTTR